MVLDIIILPFATGMENSRSVLCCFEETGHFEGTMKKYLLSEPEMYFNHAGSKARDDIKRITSTMGFEELPVIYAQGGNKIDKITSAFRNWFSWSRILSRMQTGDIILLQYPQLIYPKVSLTVLPLIDKAKKGGVKFIFLIHDLMSLRGYESNRVDFEWLSRADVIISHNARMTQQLHVGGLHTTIIDIGIFDYLIDSVGESQADVSNRSGIDIAGNLSTVKAGYVYKLHRFMDTVDFNLYGPKFNLDAKERIWYRGSIAPDELPLKLHGRFGLIWDGPSINTCEGVFGRYLKVNNPHKLSLFLASGMPVLIWNEAAEAQFVEDNNVGIGINDIAEGIEIANSISDTKYNEYLSNVGPIQNKLLTGYYGRQAIARAVDSLSL